MKRKLLCLLLSIMLVAGTLSAVIPSTALGNTGNTPTPLAAPSDEATPNKYTPAVNNGDYGYTEQVEYYEGDEVTLTAVPFIGYTFDGWYASSAADAAKLSDSTLYTVATKKYSDVTDSFISDPGAENTAKGTVLYTAGGTSDEWTANSGASGTVEVSHLRHNTGNNSFKTTISGKFVGRKLTGLKKNQTYKFSYWFYLPTPNSSQTAKIYKTLVTASADAAAVNDSLALTDPKVLGYAGEAIGASKWQQVSVEFNTGDNTDVTVWLRIAVSGFSDIMTFFDDFTLGENSSNASVDLYNIEARFTPGADAVSGLGFETGYTASSTPIVSFNSNKDPNTGEAPDGEYVNSHSFWNITSTYRLTWQTLLVSNRAAHSGNNSIQFSGMYSWAGIKLPLTLKKNTNYMLSFFVGSDYNTNAINTVYIMTKDGVPTVPLAADDPSLAYDNRRREISVEEETVIVKNTNRTFCTNDWNEVLVPFNSGDNTEISVWLNYSSQGTIYVDSFNVFEYYEASVIADIGGSASVTGLHGSYAAAGATILCSATPERGNTFLGWFDTNGNCVSTEANYYATVTSDLALTAKFEGFNTPTRELFAVNGYDGTFENGTINGWSGYHVTDSSHWCSYSPYAGDSFEGDMCLRISASYRTSILPLSNLRANTNYALSLYVKQHDGATPKTIIEGIGVIGDSASRFQDSNAVLSHIANVAPGTDWHKVTIHFNSSDYTQVRFLVKYNAEPGDDPYIYIDNMFLYEYTSADEVMNGTFDSDNNGWINNISYNSADKAGLLENAGDYTYQNLNVDKTSSYTVKFRAKGDIFAAATEVGAGFPNVSNALSSVSYAKVDSADWNEYSFDFYSGERKGVTLAFGSTSGAGNFDNVTVTKNGSASGSVLENVDFETERFAIKLSDPSVWSIYEGSEGDANVHSGTKSLKYTYKEANRSSVVSFVEAYMGAQLTSSSTYHLVFWYKAPAGKPAGSINLSPDYDGVYGTNKGFEYSPDNSEWKRATFIFTTTSQTSIKSMIKTVAGATRGDFYFDDITLSVAEPALTQETTRYTYTEELYNAVENSNFEEAVSDSNWANLQSTMKVVTGDALKGSHYLSASAGTKYVLKVPVAAGREYHFGASVRASSKAEGYIGVALSEDVDLKSAWYCSEETSEPNSRFGVTEFDGKWHRQGFQFVSNTTGYAYIAIVVTSGTIDFDSISMFLPDYKYWYDPNDYTVYEDYDFEATTSATCVINGGYGDQPYYKKAN